MGLVGPQTTIVVRWRHQQIAVIRAGVELDEALPVVRGWRVLVPDALPDVRGHRVFADADDLSARSGLVAALLRAGAAVVVAYYGGRGFVIDPTPCLLGGAQ